MLNIYLCGAILVTAAAMMFPAATPAPAFLAGVLWPVVVVGVIQIVLIQLVATVIRARTVSTDPSPAMPETSDSRTPVLAGSHR